MNEKDLLVFRRTDIGEKGIETKANITSDKDAFGVALSIFHLVIKGDNAVSMWFSYICNQFENDENFRNMLKDATVEMPDFNDLLHKLK